MAIFFKRSIATTPAHTTTANCWYVLRFRILYTFDRYSEEAIFSLFMTSSKTGISVAIPTKLSIARRSIVATTPSVGRRYSCGIMLHNFPISTKVQINIEFATLTDSISCIKIYEADASLIPILYKIEEADLNASLHTMIWCR